ncbi:hypothetical protein [Furfurilactobacillus rossiae]|uniref:Uncharacterized protein n=1 Tax=Furfurilactobacillus rossiae DSM 15814 TaxID=1114972 RepID=A0A0R1R7E3_9LACO|nr:hypothetical protein [Furfurilactobacillus rossiae]KRL52950.1 hypothetical protein FD35_GL001528 [Furfurilactobacillus rossiae DSM 15814]QFR67984.1 hypothetical protein LR814_13150 [Furfurilactobacillus rossiae]QLE60973.1 hypothetical protein LROSRS0_0926 [Furfurilactobacillus rossiae]
MTKLHVKNITATRLVIFAIFLILPLIIFNTVLTTPIKLPTDAYYHLSRISNLSGNSLAFLYPQNFQTLGQFGVATNIFYPAASFQLLMFFLPHLGIITTYKLLIFLNIELLLFSTYFTVSFAKVKNEFYKATFSILFTLSISISTGFIALGESLAFVGIPWLTLGLWLLNNPQKNKKASCFFITLGLSIPAFSHLMTFLFLSIFTLIYFLILLIKTSNKIAVARIGIFSALTSLFSCLGSIIPIFVINHLNNVKPPVVDLRQFETSFISANKFFSFSDNLDSFAIVFIVIIFFFLKIRPQLGSIMGIVMTLLGTDLFSWSQLMKHSALQTMQMPARLFRPGLGITLMFCFFSLALSNNKLSKSWFKSTLTILLMFLTINTTSAIRSNLFPDIKENGKFEVMTQNIVNMGVTQHIG